MITQSGFTINNYEIHGRVIVQAPNVTITNSLITGRIPTTGRGALVQNHSGQANLVVRNSIIQETSPSVDNPQCVVGYNFTIDNTLIDGCLDNVQIRGDNVTIKNSTLKNAHWWSSDPDQGGGPSHSDGVQILQGDNVSIIGNSITGSPNFAVLGSSEQGSVNNLQVKNNFLQGGGSRGSQGPGQWTAKFSNKSLVGAVQSQSIYVGGNTFGGSSALVDLIVARGVNFHDLGNNIKQSTGSEVQITWADSGG